MSSRTSTTFVPARGARPTARRSYTKPSCSTAGSRSRSGRVRRRTEMTRFSRVFVPLALGAAVAAVATGGGASGCACKPEPPAEAWTTFLSDLDGAVLSFWGESRQDLFAVGGTLELVGGAGLV